MVSKPINNNIDAAIWEEGKIMGLSTDGIEKCLVTLLGELNGELASARLVDWEAKTGTSQ